ncbi:hypothetical protein [Streptomyces gilvosporeus]|nr:hypothetical protein [Streptomyces gilvosporeus]
MAPARLEALLAQQGGALRRLADRLTGRRRISTASPGSPARTGG